MFHRIKHLILIVAGVAALAAGTFTPIASAAPKTQTSEDDCARWADWFNSDFAQAAAYDRAGNTQLANDYYAKMAHDYQLAHDAGCDWAQQIAPPQTTTTHMVAVRLGGAVLAR